LPVRVESQVRGRPRRPEVETPGDESPAMRLVASCWEMSSREPLRYSWPVAVFPPLLAEAHTVWLRKVNPFHHLHAKAVSLILLAADVRLLAVDVPSKRCVKLFECGTQVRVGECLYLVTRVFQTIVRDGDSYQ
jgi:hypothetical protein